MRLLLRWLINAVALFVATQLVDGIVVVGGIAGVVLAALVIGLVNALIRPLIKKLTCPLIILTLGLFTLVINAAMLWVASLISQALGIGFRVESLGAAFWGAIVITIVSFVLSLFIRDKDR